MADSVKIRITGDDSDFRAKLSGLGSVAGKAIAGISAATGALTAAWSAAGVAVVRSGSDFSATMSEVQALSNATVEEFALLKQAAKDYGASTVFSASQSADALKYMALAGWDATQSISALPGVLNLAAASGMDLGASSDMVTDYLSAFDMAADQAAYFSDMLAYAQSNSNTSAEALGDAYHNSAANLHAAGQDVEIVTAALMAMANQGLKGAEAGTALSAMMRDIGNRMQDGAIKIGTASVAVADAEGNYRDLTDILADVSAAVDGMGSAERTTALSTTFTADSIRGMNLLLNAGVEPIRAYEQGLRGATGAAENMANTMLDNLSGDVTLFQSALEGLQINAFSGIEPMTRSIVQSATGILEDLNAAYSRSGIDGLADAVIAQIPRVTNAIVQAAQSGLSAVSKKLPQLVRGLVNTLPRLLSSGGSIATELTGALFDVTAAAVEGVVAQLPDLLPVIMDGVLNLAGRIVEGVSSAFVGIGKGMTTALKKLGFVDWSEDELLDQMFAGTDEERKAALRASVDIQPDVTINEPDIELTSVYDIISAALTDGLADTPEVIEDLQGKVTDYYNAQIAEVNRWREEALAGLDSTLPVEEYNAAAQQINEQADSVVAGLKAASDETIVWIDQNAGKSTEVVQQHLGELDAIYQRAVELRGQIGEMTGEAQTLTDRQREVVAAGQSRDSATQLSAIATTHQQYADAMTDAAAARDAALADALASFEAGTDAYAQREAEILGDYEAAESAAQRQFQADMGAVWAGIASASMPDQQAMLTEIASRFRGRDLALAIQTQLAEAMDAVGAGMDAADYRDYFLTSLDAMSLTDADYQLLASALGIDAIDPQEIRSILVNQLSEAAAGAGMGTVLGMALQTMIGSAQGDLRDELSQHLDLLPTEIKDLVSVALEDGYLEGIGSADLSDAELALMLLSGQFVDLANQTIGKPHVKSEIDVEPTVEADPTADVVEDVQQIAGDAAAEAAETVAPTEVASPISVTTNVQPGDGNDLQNAVQTELAAQQMDVAVTAAVTLNVELADSNAGAVGEAAGQTIGTGVVTGLNSKSSIIRQAGVDAGSAYQRGLASQRTAILSTATGIANAVARTLQTATSNAVRSVSASVSEIRTEPLVPIPALSAASLQSRATAAEADVDATTPQLIDTALRISEGVQQDLTTTLRATSGVLSSVNLTPRVTLPDLSGLFDEIIDAQTDAPQIPVQLLLNGKIIAQTMVDQHFRAANGYNRRVALGVGK